jgi:hypothetical protein
MPGLRPVDGDECLADRERGAAVGEPDLDYRLDALGDQQVAKQVAVAFRQGDRLEVPLAVACPWRALACESVAYGTDRPHR